MKRFILVFSVMFILFLTGCNKNQNIENSNLLENQKQEVVDNNSDDSVKFEEEQYKLSDSYYLDKRKIEYPEYNIVRLDEGNLEIVNSLYTFESDNSSFEISVDKTININGTPIMLSARVYNDKNEIVDDEVPLDIEGNYQNVNVGVIDLDENDNYKEFVVYDVREKVYIYRITNSGLKLLKEFDTYWGQNGLMKIDNTWIFANTFGPNQNYNFILGYDLFENGEFKHIDRLATGELIYSNNGELPEKFQEIVFKNNANDGGPCIQELSTETEFNIVSYDFESNQVSIRMLKGGYINEEDFSTKTYLPEGTILKDIRIGFMW